MSVTSCITCLSFRPVSNQVTAASHDEIPESTADQAIAAIYAEIRKVSGLPGINLFYRRLAFAGSDVLGAFWQQVAPLYDNRILHRAGALIEQRVTLPARFALDAPLLKAAGVAPDSRAGVRATLRYFNRANAMHLVLFSVLARSVFDDGAEVAPLAVDVDIEFSFNGDDELLPLLAWDNTPPASAVLIGALRDRLAPDLADTIRPTLLRHFAAYPVLLGALYGYVVGNNGALSATIEASRADALAVAKPLAEQANITFTPEVRAVIEATTHEFRQIIPVMLVLGTAMARGFQNGTR